MIDAKKPIQNTELHASIQPWRCYTAHEAAAWLGLPDPRTSSKAIYHIPETDLPRRYVGEQRGSIRFLGIDIICYILGVPPMDLSAEVEKVRSALRPAAKPKPLHTTRSRVL